MYDIKFIKDLQALPELSRWPSDTVFRKIPFNLKRNLYYVSADKLYSDNPNQLYSLEIP